MNIRQINNEIKYLRFVNISHIVTLLISIFINYVGLKEYYFTYKILYVFFKYSSIFIIIFIVIPIMLLIVVPIIRDRVKVLQFLQDILFNFIFIAFSIGLLINITVWYTSFNSESFIKVCPFHFTSSLLQKIMEKSNNDDFCKIRMCYLYSEDDSKVIPYSYICNYDSSKEFDYKNDMELMRINSEGKTFKSNVFISCKILLKVTIPDETFISYTNFCHKNYYYDCQLFDKTDIENNLSINNEESCPESSYTKTAFLLGVSFLLIDIVCLIFEFVIEFIILKKIINFNIPEERNKENHSTINSSIKNVNQQDNNSGNNEEFKKEPTEIIIIENKNSYNSNINIENSAKEEDKKVDLNSTMKENEKEEIFNFNKINLKLIDKDKEDEKKRNIYQEIVINVKNNKNEPNKKRDLKIDDIDEEEEDKKEPKIDIYNIGEEMEISTQQRMNEEVNDNKKDHS